MSAVAVLGLGSAHGDDRVGWEVIAALAAAPLVGADGVLRVCRSPGELMAGLCDCRCAILVDGVRTGATPGTVHCLDGHALPQPLRSSLSTHGVDLVEFLALAEVLGQRPHHAVLYGIEVAQWQPEADLSPPVAAAVPTAVARIQADLAKLYP